MKGKKIMSIKSISSRKLTSKLIASSLLIAGITGIASKATANSVDIDFAVNVTESCAFSDVTGGVLVEPTSGTTFTTSSNGVATLTCNTNTATLDIAKPTDAGNPATADLIEFSGTITPPAASGVTATTMTSVTADQTDIPLGIGANAISLSMEATLPSGAIPAGNYTYTMVLTANPN